MTYQVKLQEFEGPLDLLLHMIRKNELDIYNISVSEIANQYLEYVALMQSLNLDGVGDFLVMAATLAYHKSKMLLPASEDDQDDEDDAFESLEALHQRLIEYQRYKEVAQALGEKDMLNRDVFKVHLQVDETGLEPEEPRLKASLFDLMDAFNEIMKQAPKEVVHEVLSERIQLVDRIVEVLDIIQQKHSVGFKELFEPTASKEVFLVTFLSILELVRLQLIHAYQFEPFGAVQLKLIVGDENQKEKLKQALTSYEY